MKHICFLILTIFSLILTSCGGNSSKSGDTSYLDGGDDYSNYTDYSEEYTAETPDYIQNDYIEIAYEEMYGSTITIPVKINGMGLDMIFDTGASSTCITLAEAQYLFDKGKLDDDDIIDIQEFQTADGNISVGLRIVLRDVSIGNKIHLQNIETIVVQNQQAPLLLGQSIMKKFKEISVNRENKVVKFFE